MTVAVSTAAAKMDMMSSSTAFMIMMGSSSAAGV
jgi:hypothetical protein